VNAGTSAASTPNSEVTVDFLRRLLAHLEWADQKVLDSLSPECPARAVELYAHVLGAEHVWLTRLQQTPATVAVWPSLTREECRQRAAANAAGLKTFLAALSATDLERTVPYTNSAGQSFASRIDDIVIHTCMHGHYHRAQVALLLRGADLPPAPTDFIAFVRGARLSLPT
jgi:uncharacterized damage-inducible protein DinB